MPYYSHGDLADISQRPESDRGFFEDLAIQVKVKACELWREQPGGFAFGLSGGVSRVAWNMTCGMPPGDFPYLNLPEAGFSGGQCTNRYQIYMRVVETQASQNSGNIICQDFLAPQPQFPLIPFGGRGSVWGPIYSMRLGNLSASPCGGFQDLLVDCHGEGAFPRSATRVTFTIPVFRSSVQSAKSIVEIQLEPEPGGFDNCGDPPPGQFPPAPPPTPQTFNFTFNDNSTTEEVPFEWNGNFVLPMVFVNPSLNITFDFGGISFNFKGPLFGDDGSPNPYVEVPPPSLPPGTPPESGGDKTPKLPTPEDSGGDDLPPREVPPNDEFEEDPPANQKFKYLLIEVIEILENSRYVIPSQNPDQDVVFAGHVNFKIIGATEYGSAPEYPIRRRRTIVPVPETASGYRVISINNARLSVKPYTVAIVPIG